MNFKDLDPITSKQAEVLAEVVKFIRRNGFSPTYKNIAYRTSFKSIGAVAGHIGSLQAKGYIKLDNTTTRRIDLSKAMHKIPPRYIKKKIIN